MIQAAFSLRDWRRNLGKSKSAMAEWVGIGLATWINAENGEPISERTQKAIADKRGETVTEAFPEPDEAVA